MKFAVAAPNRTLTIWKSGVPHGEYTAMSRPEQNSGLFKIDMTQARVELTKQLSVRMVIGTHKPLWLSEHQLKQIAVACDMGATPHRYKHNNRSNVAKNKMSKAKTQYKVSRKQSGDEADMMANIKNTVENDQLVSARFDRFGTIHKHISGVPQDDILDKFPELGKLLSS